MCELALVLAGERLAGEKDLAVARDLEPGDEVEQRRLAAPGRAGDRDELTGGNHQIDPTQRPHRSPLRFEPLAQANGPQHFRQSRHDSTLNLGDPRRKQVNQALDRGAGPVNKLPASPVVAAQRRT